MNGRAVRGRIEVTASVLREIVTIILALSFTGAIAAFLTTDGFVPVDVAKISLSRVFVFLCLLPTIVRFYHGNVSYLHATYGVSDAEAGPRHYATKLALDFVVFLIQAIIFSSLAIFQSQTHLFFALFVCLFVVDATWCLVNIWFSGWTFRGFEGAAVQHHMHSQLNWMFTNFAAALLIAIPLGICWQDGASRLEGWVPYFFGVVSVNAAADYWLNRRLYFPPGSVKRTRKIVFVGARFTGALTSGTFDPQLRKLIECAHEVARSRGLVVRSAHEEEEFGAALSKPETLVPRDLEQIAEADIFVGIWDSDLSPGLLIELGWASALAKQIILLLPTTYDAAAFPMVRGLAEVTSCHIRRYDGTVASAEDALHKALASVLGPRKKAGKE